MYGDGLIDAKTQEKKKTPRNVNNLKNDLSSRRSPLFRPHDDDDGAALNRRPAAAVRLLFRRRRCAAADHRAIDDGALLTTIIVPARENIIRK